MGEMWAQAGIEEEFSVVGGFGTADYFASGWELRPGSEVYTRIYFISREDGSGRRENERVLAVHIPRTNFIACAQAWRRKFWEAPH